MEIAQKRKFSFSGAIFLVCLLFVSSIFAQKDEQTRSFELENGLKVFLYERHTLPLVNLVFAINVGSKDESDETSGFAHLLEHCILFRGTGRQSGEEIAQATRRHGAYFNAHTGKDLATFEMSLPSEHLDFALINQKEILFDLKLDQESLDKEKQVILEEINQIHDDPIKYSTSLVYENLFKDHAYQKPIYGDKEIIKSATVEQLEKFYRSHFVPANSALAIVGDIDIDEVEEKVKKIFGKIHAGTANPNNIEPIEGLKKTIEVEFEMDVNQAYLAIGMIGPDYNSTDQYANDVLIEILSRGINPMINSHMRSRRIMASSLSMGSSMHRAGGVIFVYIAVDPKRMNAAKREAVRFLKETRTLNFSPDDYIGQSRIVALDYLTSAKNQIRFKIHLAQETGLLLATSLARYLLLNENEERGSYLENMERIRTSDLRKAAGKYYSQGRYVLVTINPLKEN
jgi:predicted Zn-dependent peptidase